MKKILIYIMVAILATACSCSGITKLTDAVTNPSARQVYGREFKNNDPIFAAWQKSYGQAMQDSISVAVPYVEKGAFIPLAHQTYSYTVLMKAGEMLTVQVIKDSLSHRAFMEIFAWNGAKFEKVESNENGNAYIEYPAESGIYKIVVQPEIAAQTRFAIVISKKPQYVFPVAGKGNSDILSFWGYERDNGKRSHEGIDIFAKRGTPVIAVADGAISRNGDMGLGGKQVWQRTGFLGNSVYYAHLDKIIAEEGQRVKAGDTLGFVGNSGNAKGGPPHLHFGIYRAFGGAVDPLPYVYKLDQPATKLASGYKNPLVKIKSAKANLRQSPDIESAAIGTLHANDVVTILGSHNDWLHVRTAQNRSAFLHKSVIQI